MPNGDDKNLMRLYMAINGFRARYGSWPTTVRMFPPSLEDLRDYVLGPKQFALLAAKLQIVPDEVGMIAEDAKGRTFDYGSEGSSDREPDLHAEDWLGIKSILEDDGY